MAHQPLRTEELDYDLPQELIATRPAEPRDSARMLVMSRSSEKIEHRHVRDLPAYLHAGDAIVFNNTAVVPARLIGKRIDTGGRVEGLFLLDDDSSPGSILWRMMLKAGGRLRPGVRIQWLDREHRQTRYRIELVRQEDAEWTARLESGGDSISTAAALAEVGWTPLPPYILHARGEEIFADDLDRRWYQTTFARAEYARSVAAPTAGLHFTAELLQQLTAKGVERIDVTLHVGPGTFKPVTAMTLDQHRMHSEWFEISAEAIAALSHLRRNTASKRVIAVGTTSVRTLESLPKPLSEPGQMCGQIAGMTDLMIAPPYEFKNVDGMLTNFHLPRSTLLALVAAMIGLDRLKVVYREAIRQRYRFYSYGDAMLILP